MGNSDSHPLSEKVEQALEHGGARRVSTIMKGDHDTFEFRVHALDKVTSDNKPLSMWHDIKLFPTEDSKSHNVVNMVNEIPRCTRKKYEIATNEELNPIKQDVKKGKLREFAKGDLYFNYGCMPRTWEDPDVEHPDAKAKGDNDPLDVCEIGLRILGIGEVVPVKVPVPPFLPFTSPIALA